MRIDILTAKLYSRLLVMTIFMYPPCIQVYLEFYASPYKPAKRSLDVLREKVCGSVHSNNYNNATSKRHSISARLPKKGVYSGHTIHLLGCFLNLFYFSVGICGMFLSQML